MRVKKIFLILVIIIIGMTSLKAFQLREYAVSDHNVLFVTKGSTINDKTMTDMLSDLGRAYNITVTNISITEGMSLEEAISNLSESEYTDVIIQSSYDNLSNQAWSSLQAVFAGDDVNFVVGMPWIELTESERAEVKDKCNDLFSNTSIRVLDRVYANLLEVKEAGIEVADSTGTLTKAGELTLSCTYISEIAKDSITGLTSYDGISDTSVKTIVDKVNGTINETTSTYTPAQESTTEETTTTKKTTTKTTAKTTKKSTTATGTLKADPTSFNFRTFKSDREPRIRFVTSDTDYVYLDFCDCAGIKSEHTGDKDKRPKVYTCSDNKGKNKKEITDLKRPTLAQYKKQDTEYVYTVGIPAKYVGENKSFFYAVAYDSDKSSDVIREYFSVKRKSDGTFSVDRAPRSVAVTTSKDTSKIGFLAKDYSGIASIKVRTIKKDGTDTLGEWNGTVQKEWSQVESVTSSKKNVVSAITNMNKVSTFFKNRSWKGKNPKVTGKNGVYKFVIETKDSSGLSCVKTMSVNTTQVHVGSKYETITSKKKTTSSSSSKNAGYWEIKNKKYIYHYKNGTTKQFSKSCYNANKKIQDVKAIDPNLPKNIKVRNNTWTNISFTYAGIFHPNYYCYDTTATDAAIKNGTSQYAIAVDLDVANLHIFKRVNGTWIPERTYNVNVGAKSSRSGKQYAKSNTPSGLHYINGNRQPVANKEDPCHYWVAFGAKGHNDYNEDYIHYSTTGPKGDANGVSGEVKGIKRSPACITLSWDRAKWIYYHIGRGTPVLIY